MDNQQAKAALLLYRPGSNDASDPEIASALAHAQRDPELRAWFEAHCAFQQAMRSHFRAIKPPAGLREQILARHEARPKIVWWKSPWTLAAAAILIALLGLASLFVPVGRSPDVAAYRQRMVRTALRNYRMDLMARDLNQIREFVRKNSPHGDYVLTKNLESLRGEGCALLSWQGRKVSMICLESREKKDLYLFVINAADLEDKSAKATPSFSQVNKLMTATWSTLDKTYILAGQLDEETLRKYL